jgi:hypothetical protein
MMKKACTLVFFELILMTLVWLAAYIFSIAASIINGGGLREALSYILDSPTTGGIASILYGQSSGRWAYIAGVSGDSYDIVIIDLFLFFVSSYVFSSIIYIEKFRMEIFGSKEAGLSISLSLIYFVFANLKYFFVKFGFWK